MYAEPVCLAEGRNVSSIDASGVEVHYSQPDAYKDSSVLKDLRHHFELIYVADGVTESYRADSRAANIFFTPPSSNRYRAYLSQQASWSLRFSLDAVDGHLRLLLAPLSAKTRSYSLPATDRSRWEERFRYLRHELHVERFGDSGIVRAILRSVLVDLLGLAHLGPAQKVRGRSLLDSVFGFIDEHYRYPIGLRDVAREVHLSPAYLTDLVRRKTGKPVHQWITDRRIHEARILLARTDRSVASIADTVGFNDPSYFCRQFVKIVGTSPGASRTADRRSQIRDFNELAAPWRDVPVDQCFIESQKIRELADELIDLTQPDLIARRALSAAFETLRPSVAQYIERCANDGSWHPRLQIACTRRPPELPIATDADGVLALILAGQTKAAQDLADSPNDWLRNIARLGFTCTMVAPIRTGRQCVGGIRVLKMEKPAFSERERATLATIGSLTGLALRGIARSPSSHIPAPTSLRRTEAAALGIVS